MISVDTVHEAHPIKITCDACGQSFLIATAIIIGQELEARGWTTQTFSEPYAKNYPKHYCNSCVKAAKNLIMKEQS